MVETSEKTHLALETSPEVAYLGMIDGLDGDVLLHSSITKLLAQQASRVVQLNRFCSLFLFMSLLFVP